MTDARRSSWMGWLPREARRRCSEQESTGGGATRQPRGGLVRKYVLLIVGLVSLVLLLNSALDFWFSYALAETAELEDVMAVLREYHCAFGPLIHRHEGMIDSFTGDGLIVIFNDPIPCPDAALRAVRLAVDMRETVASLARSWTARGHEIGFGVGIAQGY